MIYQEQTALLVLWAFYDCTTNNSQRVISTPIHIGLATYTLLAMRKVFAFPLALGQSQHVGVMREL